MIIFSYLCIANKIKQHFKIQCYVTVRIHKVDRFRHDKCRVLPHICRARVQRLYPTEWCKQWKRKGGIQRCYEWQLQRTEQLRKSNKEAMASVENARIQVDMITQRMQNLKDNMEALKKEYNALQEIASKYDAIQRIIER